MYIKKKGENVIIKYDQKYLLKKMRCTCRKKNLVYQGPYQLRILRKVVTSPAPGYDPDTIFYVETDDHKYKGILEVTPREYDKGKVGQYYGRGGVVFNIKKEDCYYMSKYDSASLAIRKAVNWSRIRIVFLVIVILLFIDTIILFLLPLFK